jgi:hypothetical protein
VVGSVVKIQIYESETADLVVVPVRGFEVDQNRLVLASVMDVGVACGDFRLRNPF